MNERCYTLTVPENYSNPQSRSIALDTVVVPAHSTFSKKAVFLLFGGPGVRATTSFAADEVNHLAGTHDVVVIDQRGSGNTPDIRCQSNLTNDNFALLGNDNWSTRQLLRCLRRLRGSVDLTQYTTSNTVRDLEQARIALGYSTIDLIGYSYGTRVALEYLRRYPDRLHTVTLAGALPPEVRLPVGVARNAEASLLQIISRCTDEDACHRQFPKLLDDLESLKTQLASQGLWVTITTREGRRRVRLGAGLVTSYLRSRLYSSDTAKVVPLIIHELAISHPPGYGDQVVEWREAFEKSGSWGLYLSVSCSEDFYTTPFAELHADAVDTFFGDYRAEQLRKACAIWPRGDVPSDFHSPVHAAVPTLVVSGALDPVTPPIFGEQIANALENVKHITFVNGSHINAEAWGGCLGVIVDHFIENAELADIDTSCAENISFPPFSLSENTASPGT